MLHICHFMKHLVSKLDVYSCFHLISINHSLWLLIISLHFSVSTNLSVSFWTKQNCPEWNATGLRQQTGDRRSMPRGRSSLPAEFPLWLFYGSGRREKGKATVYAVIYHCHIIAIMWKDYYDNLSSWETTPFDKTKKLLPVDLDLFAISCL